MKKKILVVEDDIKPEVYKRLFALDCIAAGFGIETVSENIHRKFKDKEARVITEFDLQRIEKAKQRREKRKAKRLKNMGSKHNSYQSFEEVYKD